MRGIDEAEPRRRDATLHRAPLALLCALALAPLAGCSEEYPIGRYTDSDSESDSAVDTDPSGDTDGMNTSLSGTTTTATSGGTSGATSGGSSSATSGGTSGVTTSGTGDTTGLHATTTTTTATDVEP